jgi:hypothetical protein
MNPSNHWKQEVPAPNYFSNHWKKRFEEVPGLRAYLKPIAKKWAKGLALPHTMTLGAEPRDPALRTALAGLFGGRVFYRGGKVIAEIPHILRDEKILGALAAELGIERPTATQTPVSTILLRLRLTHPRLSRVHQWLATAPEIERLLAADPQKEQLLLGLLQTASHLCREEKTITLSKLGSLFFNDSKCLRSGTPRKLLGGMMNAQLGTEESPENREIALQQFGVIDNPATTTVTLFGPIDLIRSGTSDRWIVDRFNAGEPVTLNSYNLDGIDAVGLRPGYESVITSENAAPFHELVEEHPKAILVYTAGYPNAAVCRLLRLLHEAGATCRHWGDTDPDGYQIAALIDRYIKTALYRCGTDELLANQAHLKPYSLAQSSRGRQFLTANPQFKFREELELTLELGGWLEQEKQNATQ